MVKSLLGHSVTYKYVFTRCSVLNDLAEVEFVAGITSISWITIRTWDKRILIEQK